MIDLLIEEAEQGLKPGAHGQIRPTFPCSPGAHGHSSKVRRVRRTGPFGCSLALTSMLTSQRILNGWAGCAKSFVDDHVCIFGGHGLALAIYERIMGTQGGDNLSRRWGDTR
jgi:hypothetical protein